MTRDPELKWEALDGGKTRRERWARNWLWMVVGLGVGLRMGLGQVRPMWYPDSTDYDTLAKAILGHGIYRVPNTLPGEGGGFSLASRMPGYPVFLAGMYALGRAGMGTVLVAQAILGGISIVLTYLIARRVNETVALIAATLAAFDPLSIGFSAAVLSETPFTFCMLLSLWVLLWAMERGQVWWRWLLVGEIWGIAVYFRASALWCLVPLVGYAAWAARVQEREKWMRVLGAMAAIVMMFVILSPWLYRNYMIFHSGPLRLTTLEGLSLYEAVYPGADGSPKQDKIVWPEEFLKLNEAERNDEWARRARQEIAADPGRVLGLAVKKMGRTWSPWFNGGEFMGRVVQAGMVLWHVPLFVFGLIGLLGSNGGVRPAGGDGRVMTGDAAGDGRVTEGAGGNGRITSDGRWKGLLLIPIVYFTLVHSIYLGSVRYRVPLMPLVCIFAAAGIYDVLKRMGWVKPAAGRGV